MIRLLKASAGTGKTYRLSREYIRLLLTSDDPTPYRHILAVTFTNKATDEMKRRILKELHQLSESPSASPYYAYFKETLGWPDVQLKQRAATQLALILHDYSAFAVSTIDKFFQQTLRAFSREIGQFASYQVDLDKPALLQESVDRVLDALTEGDRTLLEWLTEGVRTELERGGRFNLDGRLLEMAESLSSEDHDSAVRALGINEKALWTKERLRKVGKSIKALTGNYVAEVRQAAVDALAVLEAHSIRPEDSNRGFMKALYTYRDLGDGDPVAMPTPSFLANAADSSKWFSRSKDGFRVALEGSLEEPLGRLTALFGQPYRIFSTARLIREQLYGLGVAGELRAALTEIQKEKNVLSLDDSNALLRGIIDGTDAPFIYEKMGVRYEHFLLDEFQDTSTIQWDNFRPLVENALSGGHDSLIVGDVKQAIYRWRGSDWNLLASRVQEQLDVPEDQVENMDKNYRTCRQIVDFNRDFFAYAAQELDRLLGQPSIAPLYGRPKVQEDFRYPEPGSVDVVFVEDQMEEILQTIRDVMERGARYGDIAILVRGNAEGSAIAQRLVAEKIPVVSDDSLFVKTSVTVRRLISLLTRAVQPPVPGERPGVGSFLAQTLRIDLPEGAHTLVDLSEDLLRSLRTAYPAVFEAEIPYIRAFMDHLSDWVSIGGNDLAAFLKDWESSDPKIVSPDVGASVRVMTVHKSKGLEFPYVIFPFAEKVSLYKASSLWCHPAVEGTPLSGDGEGLFHVSLSSASDQTLFSEDYHREQREQMMDNFNIFYVAMTRPVYGLKVISALPPKKVTDDGSEDWKDMSQVLYGYLKCHSAHQGEPYDFSKMDRKTAAERPRKAAYPSWKVDERERLRFSKEAFDYFGPDGTVGPHSSARRRGLVLHDILSGIRCPSDLPRSVERVILSGELEAGDREGTLRFLEEEIASVAARGWFPEDGSRILNEETVLARDGSIHRPDRVVLHPDGSVEIIDYKFGAPSPAYPAQVRRYMDLFRAMGYAKVSGYLWFVRETEEDEILEIR